MDQVSVQKPRSKKSCLILSDADNHGKKPKQSIFRRNHMTHLFFELIGNETDQRVSTLVDEDLECRVMRPSLHYLISSKTS